MLKSMLKDNEILIKNYLKTKKYFAFQNPLIIERYALWKPDDAPKKIEKTAPLTVKNPRESYT